MRVKTPRLVRYIPMIGSPGWLTPERAKAELRREDRLYMQLVRVGFRPNLPRIQEEKR